MSLVVRKAQLADLEAIQALWSQVTARHATLHPEFFAEPREPAPSHRELRQLLSDWARSLLVAEDDGSVIALVQVGVYDTPRAAGFARRRRGCVDEIVVDPRHRGRGFGRALMEAAEAWCRRRGACQLVLTVWEGNDEADRFYRRLGYTQLSHVMARDL